MSEIFPSYQEPVYPSHENTWRHDLAANNPGWSDHRQGGLPYDERYPLESTTLPEGFEEVTEITEIDDIAPDSQPNSARSTDGRQADTPRTGMNEEEVARARALVASMFSGRSNEKDS